jgi:hypothetical protein
MIRAILAAGITLVACAPLSAHDEEDAPAPLTGDYIFFPAEEESGTPPSVYVTLTGEAAKTIYEGLAAKAENDECQGGTTKWLAEGGFCNYLAEQKTYFCSFGIDLKESKFAFGQDC